MELFFLIDFLHKTKQGCELYKKSLHSPSKQPAIFFFNLFKTHSTSYENYAKELFTSSLNEFNVYSKLRHFITKFKLLQGETARED